MTIQTTTHLNFHGEAREALELYASVSGGRLTVMTYGDLGMPAGLPDTDRVVFGQVTSDDGFRVMAYDVPSTGGGAGPTPQTSRENGTTVTTDRFFLSVRGASVEDVLPLWEGLSDGASVVEPFATSAWSPGFGMLTDRFGVTWVVDVAAG